MSVSGVSSSGYMPFPVAREKKEGMQGVSFEDSVGKIAAKEEFVKFSKMSPAEKIRYIYLKKHGLTEETLANMPAEVRKKVEDEIKEEIKKALRQKTEEKGSSTSAVDLLV